MSDGNPTSKLACPLWNEQDRRFIIHHSLTSSALPLTDHHQDDPVQLLPVIGGRRCPPTGADSGAVKFQLVKSTDSTRATARPENQFLYQSYFDHTSTTSGNALRVRPYSTYLDRAGSHIQCVAPSQIASVAQLLISFQ